MSVYGINTLVILFQCCKTCNHFIHRRNHMVMAVYGNEASKERQFQNWFSKFPSGDFYDLKIF